MTCESFIRDDVRPCFISFPWGSFHTLPFFSLLGRGPRSVSLLYRRTCIFFFVLSLDFRYALPHALGFLLVLTHFFMHFDHSYACHTGVHAHSFLFVIFFRHVYPAPLSCHFFNAFSSRCYRIRIYSEMSMTTFFSSPAFFLFSTSPPMTTTMIERLTVVFRYFRAHISRPTSSTRSTTYTQIASAVESPR